MDVYAVSEEEVEEEGNETWGVTVTEEFDFRQSKMNVFKV